VRPERPPRGPVAIRRLRAGELAPARGGDRRPPASQAPQRAEDAFGVGIDQLSPVVPEPVDQALSPPGPDVTDRQQQRRGNARHPPDAKRMVGGPCSTSSRRDLQHSRPSRDAAVADALVATSRDSHRRSDCCNHAGAGATDQLRGARFVTEAGARQRRLETLAARPEQASRERRRRRPHLPRCDSDGAARPTQ
jgi:hypothetical protein